MGKDITHGLGKLEGKKEVGADMVKETNWDKEKCQEIPSEVEIEEAKTGGKGENEKEQVGRQGCKVSDSL